MNIHDGVKDQVDQALAEPPAQLSGFDYHDRRLC